MKLITSALLMISLILTLVADNTLAHEKKGQTPFSNFRVVKINNYPILIDPQLKFSMIKNDVNNESFGKMYGAETIRISCEKYKIDIGFNYGPSVDPSYFVVVTDGNNIHTKSIDTDNLAVSLACQFYAIGQTDKSFAMRQKYTITEKGIQETVQPFYLVDKVCSSSTSTTITTEKCGKGSIVANIPKGSNVRILASEWFQTDDSGNKISQCGSEKESYLVSTPFGLVGWVENKRGDISGKPGSPLSCIIFHGD